MTCGPMFDQRRMTTATPRITFNGKFLSAPPTGVHRVAGELIAGIDRLLASDSGARSNLSFELVAPPDANRELSLRHIPRVRGGPLTWQFWEQLELPIRCRDTLVVSLCNLSPVLAPRSVTMIHDAQVFLSPGSYATAFRNWYRFALPAIGARARRILTVSNFSRGQLTRYGIAPWSSISVVPNGADHMLRDPAEPEVLARLKLTPGRYVVGLANTQEHKNIGLLFRTFARPRMRAMKLVLIGAATAAEFSRAGHKVSENVVFAGRVSDGELRALLEAASSLAFPSLTEGFGLPPLEAMILGCPAIVAPCGALPEVCGDAASYAHPQRPEMWEQQILTLAEDPAMRARESAKGRSHAATFTWERAARDLLQVLAECVRCEDEKPITLAANTLTMAADSSRQPGQIV